MGKYLPQKGKYAKITRALRHELFTYTFSFSANISPYQQQNMGKFLPQRGESAEITRALGHDLFSRTFPVFRKIFLHINHKLMKKPYEIWLCNRQQFELGRIEAKDWNWCCNIFVFNGLSKHTFTFIIFMLQYFYGSTGFPTLMTWQSCCRKLCLCFTGLALMTFFFI